jgi:hypothetical protein
MQWRNLILLTALALSGCNGSSLRVKDTPEGNLSVASIDEAGSVHVSVIAVTPWDEVKTKLRPNLKIDEKDLRNQAIPVTFSLLDKYLEIMRLQASLAPSTVKTTSTATSTSETGKDDSSKTETSTTKAPGEARKTDLPTALAAGAGASQEPAAISAINSSLTARAMASFVQDVQALNAEVDSAAKRTGFEPYLMRVQVSVMPRRRHLGYDVYSNLSFFGYGGGFDALTGAALPRTATDGTPFVVPLLSSDSVETAQRSQSIEAIRDVGLALDLVRGFGAAGFSVGSQKDRQQALSGLDVNSVLTMGRLSDNTVRIRLGAAFDPGGGFSVHPRTNTISLLVFFPKNAGVSRVVSRTSWTHVVDGTVLERSQERYQERLAPIAAQWRSLGMTMEMLERIDELPLEGNYKGFEALVASGMKTYCDPAERVEAGWSRPGQCVWGSDGKGWRHRLDGPGFESERERSIAYLWSHLLSLLPGSRFSTTIVDLPRLSPICPIGAQLASYIEDDKGISVALRAGKDLSSDKLKAAVHLAFLGRPAAATAAADAAPPGTSARGGAAARVAAAVPGSATAPAPARPVLVGHAGAALASGVVIADDRTSATLSFPTDRMRPATWANGQEMVPVAIELSGCATSPGEALPAGVTVPRLWGNTSQLYVLRTHVPKKDKPDDKPKPSVSLSVSTTDLLPYDARSSRTKVSVDLGEKPETGFALAASGGVIASIAPASGVEARPDGTYLVKASGTLDIRFINVAANRTVDLELKPVDEKNKLGASAFKISLTARGRT